MRFIGCRFIEHVGSEQGGPTKFCQRCEQDTPWVVVHPRIYICHPCYLKMPIEEFDWLTDQWEKKGIITKER